MVARLNLSEGGLEDLVVEGGVLEEVYIGVVWEEKKQLVLF